MSIASQETVTDAEELLRRVVMDYADECCDHLDTCDCSMAQAARMIGEPGTEDNGCPICTGGFGLACGWHFL